MTRITTVDPITGIPRTVFIPGARPRWLAVFRRYRRTTPFYDPKSGVQVGWSTEPADWYLAWGSRTRMGRTYRYEGLEKQQGFRTRKEALARRRRILATFGTAYVAYCALSSSRLGEKALLSMFLEEP